MGFVQANISSEVNYLSISSMKSKNELFTLYKKNSYSSSEFFDYNDIDLNNINILKWKNGKNSCINIQYSDSNLIFKFCGMGKNLGLPGLLGLFGAFITSFKEKMEDYNFRFSEKNREEEYLESLKTIIMKKKKDLRFIIVGLLSLQSHALPNTVYLDYPVKKSDSKVFEVPIALHWGNYLSTGIADRAALALSGPDFEQDIDYTLFSQGTMKINMLKEFLENCKKTGRRRNINDFPSYWPKNIFLIAHSFPLEDIQSFFKRIGLKKADLHYFITPNSSPKGFPRKGAPPCHRARIRLFTLTEDFELIEKFLKYDS